MSPPDAPPPPARTDGGAGIDIAGNEVSIDHSTLDLYLRVEGSDEQIPVTPGLLTAVTADQVETSHPVLVALVPCHHDDETEPDPWVLRDDLRVLEYNQAVDAGLIDTSLEAVGGAL